MTMEKFTDYFTRNTVEIPADEVGRHQEFSRDCPCNPTVVFDEKHGWHHFTHQALEGENESDDK